MTLYRKNTTTDTLEFEPGAGGIDRVAIAFALGAGDADTSHKPPSFKGVRPVAPVREQRVQVGEPNTEPGIWFEGMSPRSALNLSDITPTEQSSCKNFTVSPHHVHWQNLPETH